MPTRRTFITLSSLAAIGTLRAAEGGEGKPFTFGLITDVHHGTHGKDQRARLRRFIDAAIARQPDFIIQCGDFCCAKGGLAECGEFLAEWNRFPGEKHHVIGNHDCDFQSKAELLKAWGISNRYYSFDAGPFHFVVLDRNHFIDEAGNTVSYDKGNWYPIHRAGGPGHLAKVSRIDDEQLKWLADDLSKTGKPVVIFQHQPSGVGSHDGNWQDLNAVIDLHNARHGRVQVFLVICGHDHDEQIAVRHGVHHLTLTSAAFGMPFGGSTTYYEADHPPFTFVTFDPVGGRLVLEAAQGKYENQATMNPELCWVNPPRLAGRAIAVGGCSST